MKHGILHYRVQAILMKASDLMTKDVLAIDKDERLETAIDMMVKHRVSKLVVLEKKQIVGVLTNGDIADELGAIKNRGVPATHLHATSAMRRTYPSVGPDATLTQILAGLVDDAGILPVLHDKNVLGVITGSDMLRLVTSTKPLSEIMTDRLHVVAPGDRVVHARRVMIDHEIERVPVLDQGKLVGIVGEIDLALGFAHLKRTVADKHQPAALQRFLVQDIMQQNVVTATPEMTAREAVEVMGRENVGSLPVMRGGRIAGIVTRSDLLKLVPR